MTMVMMVHGRKYLIKRFGPPTAGDGEVVMVTILPHVPLDLNVFLPGATIGRLPLQSVSLGGLRS